MWNQFQGEEKSIEIYPHPEHTFDQLEVLDILRVNECKYIFPPDLEMSLDLPMLSQLWLEKIYEIDQLTLDMPRLQTVKFVDCPFYLWLDIIHGGSIKKLITSNIDRMEVDQLTNLKSLYIGEDRKFDSALLSNLEQLKKIHLMNRNNVEELYQQKKRYGRGDLKIYLFGLLLHAFKIEYLSKNFTIQTDRSIPENLFTAYIDGNWTLVTRVWFPALTRWFSCTLIIGK